MHILLFLFFIPIVLSALLTARGLIYNVRVRKQTTKLFAAINENPQFVLAGIGVSHVKKNDFKEYQSFRNKCDIHVFEDYMIILRRCKIGFTFLYAPEILTPNIRKHWNKSFDYKIYKLTKIKYLSYRKGEMIFILNNWAAPEWSFEMTLKNLTPEQTKMLRYLNTWPLERLRFKDNKWATFND